MEEKKIRAIYNPSDKAKETIRMVYDRKYAMEESSDRQKFIKNLDRWEKNYEARREERKSDEWQSNHTAPLTFSVVETALSEMVRQNLRPIILPRGEEDSSKAKLMQYIWEYAWQVSDGDVLVYNVIKELLINGMAIVQEYYRQDKRVVRDIEVINGKEKEVKKEVFDYDDVCGEIVKPTEFFVDEFARSFRGPSYKARDCIRRYVMNVDDFHLSYDGSKWDQFGDASKVKAGGDVDYYEYYKPDGAIDRSKQVEVFHYWNEPKDKFIIVANDVLIKDGPNPYKHKKLPFVRAVDVKRVHNFYAKGEPEILESIQDETNLMRRMMLDRNHLDIDKMFLVSNKMGLSDEDLMARPHGLIPTDDVNGAKAIEYGDVPRSIELGLKHLEDDSTISTGINPRSQSLPQAGTATEAAILKESTLRRIGTKIWLFKREFLIPLAQMRVSNILQFYPQPKLEKIVGDKRSQEFKNQVSQAQSQGVLQMVDGEPYKNELRQIRTKDVKLEASGGELDEIKERGYHFFPLRDEFYVPVTGGGYDIEFEAGENIEISKPLMQQKNLELFDRFMQVATQVPGSYDIVKLGDAILRDYDKNPDDFKPNPMPVQGSGVEDQIALASQENQLMMKGQPVPGTAYASPAHTEIHVSFVESDEFQLNVPQDDPRVKIFTDHIAFEIAAQTGREMQGVGAAQAPAQQMANQPVGQMKQGGAGNGMINRPGGMAKPSTTMADAMPNKNTGRTGV